MHGINLKHIKALICDVDGVLTNGQVYFNEKGDWRRFFHISDGMGIKRLQEAGIIVGVITTSKMLDIRERMAHLKIEDFHEDCFDKLPAYQAILSKYNLQDSEICYIGDDFNDIPILKRVSCGVTVPHTWDQVKRHCNYVTQREGGMGAVREVCEMILEQQDFPE